MHADINQSISYQQVIVSQNHLVPNNNEINEVKDFKKIVVKKLNSLSNFHILLYIEKII